MLVRWNAGIAQRAQENRVETPAGTFPGHRQEDVVPSRRNRSAPQSNSVRAIRWAAAETAARKTFTASRTTSLPIPSPGITAMRLVSDADPVISGANLARASNACQRNPKSRLKLGQVASRPVRWEKYQRL